MVIKNIPKQLRSGFALVSTLSIMALLVVVVLGMLSLNTVENRAARNDKYQMEAQANARMALMVALGMLQSEAGRDQVVSFRSEILDIEPSDISSTNGVEHSKYTMVVPTSAVAEDPTVGRGLGLREVVELPRVLVSGNEEVDLSGLTSYPNGYTTWSTEKSSDWVKVYGDGGDANNDVYVPRVEVKNSVGVTSGSYAFWVEDEGVKGRLNLFDKSQPLANSSTLRQI
jgi:hypothetical protein